MEPEAAYNTARGYLQAGRSFIVPFDHDQGVSWLEFRGPKGMVGGDGYYASAIPRLSFSNPHSMVAGSGGPVVDVALGGDDCLEEALARIADIVANLIPDRLAVVEKILRAVRDAVARLESRRLPRVGSALTSEGEPSIHGWASCLTLADLQEALLVCGAEVLPAGMTEE